jgi:hypothetical protein
MNNLDKEARLIKIFYRGIAIVVIVIGAFFSFLIARFNNAPGFVLLGTAAALGVAALLYGVGEMIILLKKNNALLSDMNDKLGK